MIYGQRLSQQKSPVTTLGRLFNHIQYRSIVSPFIRLRCFGAHEGHRQTLDPENLGGQPRWMSEEKCPLITALYPSLHHLLDQNDVSLQSR